MPTRQVRVSFVEVRVERTLKETRIENGDRLSVEMAIDASISTETREILQEHIPASPPALNRKKGGR